LGVTGLAVVGRAATTSITSTLTGGRRGVAVEGSSMSRRKPNKDADVSKTAAAVNEGSRPHGSSGRRSVPRP